MPDLSRTPIYCRLSARRIAFVGLRDLDPPERAMLEQHEIPHYTMMEVDRLGVREV